MSYELSDEPSYSTASQRPRIWLERLLLAAFLFCLLIGLGALAIFLVARNNAQPSLNADPLQLVRSNFIAPQIALRELSGDPAAALASQLLQAGRLETARAILTFAVDISPVERAARLTTLARAYLAANEPESAGQVYALLVSTAILEDTIPVLERANLLTQSADGLFKAGFPPAAIDAAVQATRIAAQSPGLLPAQRSALFTELRSVVESLPRADSAVVSLRALLAD
ncbi:MAG: tetratricopeptide repeat protein, partial [Caldilinea sp.]